MIMPICLAFAISSSRGAIVQLDFSQPRNVVSLMDLYSYGVLEQI